MKRSIDAEGEEMRKAARNRFVSGMSASMDVYKSLGSNDSVRAQLEGRLPQLISSKPGFGPVRRPDCAECAGISSSSVSATVSCISLYLGPLQRKRAAQHRFSNFACCVWAHDPGSCSVMAPSCLLRYSNARSKPAKSRRVDAIHKGPPGCCPLGVSNASIEPLRQGSSG